MLRNYLKLALRNIWRKKLYSVINLTGLGVASAFCILVFWYVQHEQSFDKFHRQSNRLYRVEFSQVFAKPSEEKNEGFFSFLMKNSEQKNTIQTPPVFRQELEKDFPEIENSTRIQPGYEMVVRVNDQSFKEQMNSAFVDPSFFTIFDFPLLRGNPNKVLNGRNNIVLSERAVKKYFGEADPIGKTLLLPHNDSLLYVVSGVAKDFPANSSFQFDLIVPRNSPKDYDHDIAQGLNTFSDLLILQLKPDVDATQFGKKLENFSKNYFADVLKQWASFPGSEVKAENFHIYLRPYTLAHYNVSSGWGHYTDLKNIYQLCSLTILILLIACLNYVLLTLTGTVSRSQEVGVRKTVGAPRKQIILQFYIETQLLAFFAVLLGLVLAAISLPFFSTLTGTDLRLDYLPFPMIAGFLIGLAVGLGLLAGIYPALVMSGLKPLNMMRKFSTYKLNPWLSKGLVVTQFSVCIILIISTLVISNQMRFLNGKDLGFDKNGVFTIQNPYWFDNPGRSQQLKQRLTHFAESEPALADFTSSGLMYNNSNNHLINGEKTQVEAFEVDYNYFHFMHIPLLKGRNFSPSLQEDSATLQLTDEQHEKNASAARQAAIVNETLYKLLGEPPLNEINKSLGGRIIGVCKDYYPDDLTKKIVPAYHKIQKRYIGSFSFRLRPGQPVSQAMDKISAHWKDVTAGEPLDYSFLVDNLAKSYDSYQRWMKTVTAASIIAILIAALGLFGLSGLAAVNRIKEIGIRKVLGATVSDLFVLLNKSTLALALLSFAVALPVAIYLAKLWLENFAYHIEIGPGIFVLAGVITILTAVAAVSYHTLKTATTNPVKSLRTE